MDFLAGGLGLTAEFAEGRGDRVESTLRDSLRFNIFTTGNSVVMLFAGNDLLA